MCMFSPQIDYDLFNAGEPYVNHDSKPFCPNMCEYDMGCCVDIAISRWRHLPLLLSWIKELFGGLRGCRWKGPATTAALINCWPRIRGLTAWGRDHLDKSPFVRFDYTHNMYDLTRSRVLCSPSLCAAYQRANLKSFANSSTIHVIRKMRPGKDLRYREGRRLNLFAMMGNKFDYDPVADFSLDAQARTSKNVLKI